MNRKQASTPAPTKTPTGQSNSECNIKVVIRTRCRSSREISDNSPIVLSSDGPKSQHLTVETTPPASTLGLVTHAPTRTYPFDLVFGPEADQALVYQDVVAPMLEEVVQGYNCTLFAYGQTGTGKTHTMQGDLVPTPMGNPSPQAGMIPRVLFRLFHYLDTNVTDYTVKISFIELYNEELRDLLASDLAAPASSAQPMGKGGSSSSSQLEQQGALKIFDDGSKKGVWIQGVEEVNVRDASAALALLTKGSHRRQVAATKFNDHSSRSHSIFSITVHLKESAPGVDDMLKVGKLNLVDLAGSENIGRSGAENKRAREAGMINQSLLTLGRVINALVDRSSHVPYRESKLTRLLQDSLGGRTKTCIIATVSPSRSNVEETLSTLDYALRAKSIRNKPEINQRMTRTGLLKEYVVEIERLRADVLAAREKNGIFFAEETWAQLQQEHELRRTEVADAKKKVADVETEMRAVREEFDQSIGMLRMRDKELKETKGRLQGTQDALNEKERALEKAKIELEEEIQVRKAHQDTEQNLDTVATGLRIVTQESVHDVGGLFDKIGRKSSVLVANNKAVATHGKAIAAVVVSLSKRLEDFIQVIAQGTQSLHTDATTHAQADLEALAAQSARVELQLQRVQASITSIQSQDALSDDALASVQAAIQTARDTIESGTGHWSDSLRKKCEAVSNELRSSGLRGFGTAGAALDAFAALVDTMAREANAHIASERNALHEAEALTQAAVTQEIKRLRTQNEKLLKMVEEERSTAARARDELIQRVSGLLGDFASARDKSLQTIAKSMHQDNTAGAQNMEAFQIQHTQILTPAEGAAGQAGALVNKRDGEGKQIREGGIKSLTAARKEFESGIANMQSTVTSSVASYSGEVQRHVRTLSKASASGFERHSRAKRARVEETATTTNEVLADNRQMQRNLASTSASVQKFTGRVISQSTNLASSADGYHKAASKDLMSSEQTARSLIDEGTREDTPTGLTPRKRVWQFVDQWELTKSRETVLQSWRLGSRDNLSPCDTFSQRPLPVEEVIMEDPPLPSHPPDTMEVDEPDSPTAISLESSAASSVAVPLPPLQLRAPIKRKPSASLMPKAPALMERTNGMRGLRRQR